MGIFTLLVRNHLHIWGGVPEQEGRALAEQGISSSLWQIRMAQQVFGDT